MDMWEEKRKWHKRGNGFLIEVSHHTVETYDSGCYDSEGPNRWCVYAYIYPKHPLFDTFELGNISQEATSKLPLHGGCTYIRHHLDMDDSVYITAVQIGCDYNHIYDNRYTRICAGDDLGRKEIFDDADTLFNYLEESWQK